MLAAQESRFVPAHCPVKPMRGVPALLRSHPTKDFDLLGTWLFVGKHCSEFLTGENGENREGKVREEYSLFPLFSPVHVLVLTEQALRFRQRLIQFRNFLAAAAGVVRFTATFATDDWRDGLDDFAGLDLFGQIGRNGRNERDRAVGRAPEDDDTVELAFERIGNGLEIIAVGWADFLDDRAG